MAENELKFRVRGVGGKEAAGEILSVALAAEQAVKRVAALNARIASRITTRVRDTVTGAADARAALAAERLAQSQERVRQGGERLAIGQRSIEAANLRAATSYDRAQLAAQRLGQQKERLARQGGVLDRALGAVRGSLAGLGSGLQQTGRSLLFGLTAPILALGAAAIKSAKDIDSSVNLLKAFTGSAEAAEARLAQLIATAQATPGLTTGLAATLDAQLRVLDVTEQTIDRLLPAIGRLNAVTPLGDPRRFTTNLQQLISQNFERADLKELVGQSPLAGELIKQIFDVDSPTNGKAIRDSAQRLGITSLEAFAEAFARAAESNPKLADITESLGTRFEKMLDRVTVALRPLGLAIIGAIEPLIGPLVTLIEQVSAAFAALPGSVQTAVIAALGFAAALGPVLIAAGAVVSAVSAIVGAVASAKFAIAAAAVVIVNLAPLLLALAAAAGALYLAWRENMGGVRDVAAEVFGAVSRFVTQALSTIQAVWISVWPNLASLAEKALDALRGLFAVVARLAPPMVAALRVAGDAALFFLRTFGNVIELAVKLIDGDWRGAWRAFERIAADTRGAFERVMRGLLASAQSAFADLIAYVVSLGPRFYAAAVELGQRTVAGIDAEIRRAPQALTAAFEFLLAQSALAINPANIAAILAAAVIGATAQAVEAGEAQIRNRAIAAQNRALAGVSDGEFVYGGSVGVVSAPARPAAGGGGTRAARRGGGGGGGKKEVDEKLELLKLAEQAAERIYQQETDALRRQFELRGISLREFTDAQIEAAREVLAARLATLDREEEAAKKKKGAEGRVELAKVAEERRKARGDFERAEAEAVADRDQQLFETEREHRQALLKLAEESDAQYLAELEEFVEAGAYTYGLLAEERALVERDARERQRRELTLQLKEAGANLEERKRIQDELNLLEVEGAGEVEEGERRKRAAWRQTLEAFEAYDRAIRRIQADAAEAIRAASIAALERSRLEISNRREYIRRHAQIEKEAADARRRERFEEIKAEEAQRIKALEGLGDYERRKAEIEREFNDLRKAEDRRFDEERKAREAETRRALDPFASLRDLWESFREGMEDINASIAASVQSVAQVVADSVGVMAGAFRQAIVANVLYGESISVALKKALAAQMAAIAAECYIQSLKFAAYALANAAFGNFGTAAKFAAVSVAFAAAGLAAAKIGGALAQSAGLRGGASQSATASAAVGGGQAQNQSFNYNGGPTGSTPEDPEGTGGRFTGRGLVGGPLAAIFNRLDAMEQRHAAALDNNTKAMQDNAQASRHVVGATIEQVRAVQQWTPRSPVDVLMAAADTTQGAAVIGDATVRASAANYGIPRALMEHMNPSGRW